MSEEDTKSENIMNTLFIGKEVKKCDGDMMGYSNFLHILMSSPPKPHKEIDFNEILTFNFFYKLEVDYSF